MSDPGEDGKDGSGPADDSALTPAERMAERRAARLSQAIEAARARAAARDGDKGAAVARKRRLPPPPPPDPETLRALNLPVPCDLEGRRSPLILGGDGPGQDPAQPQAPAKPTDVPPPSAETPPLDLPVSETLPETSPLSAVSWPSMPLAETTLRDTSEDGWDVPEDAPEQAEIPPAPPAALAAPRPFFSNQPHVPARAAAPDHHGLPRAPALLELEGVHTDIGRYRILHGVNLAVPEGRVTMLLGRNGVGKTTTLRTIMGLWRARSGQIRMQDTPLTRLRPAAIARRGIGYVPEDMGVFAGLTVAENMRLAAIDGPLDSARLDWLLAVFPALRSLWRSSAGTLSGGQKQMLALARAMAEPRRLYLIDEPTKGLAPAIVTQLVRALRALKDDGATILMVEQNFAVACALGDHCAVMDGGRVVWEGDMRSLADDPGLQTRLMGLNMDMGA